MNRLITVLAVIAACLVLVIIGEWWFDPNRGTYGSSLDTSAVKADTAKSDPVEVGSRGHLSLGGDSASDRTQSVVLAVDQAALDEMTKSSIAHDVRGISDLIITGRAFAVPQGTTVLVIDMAMFTRKVRVLDGDAAGQAGWVPAEWVVQ